MLWFIVVVRVSVGCWDGVVGFVFFVLVGIDCFFVDFVIVCFGDF